MLGLSESFSLIVTVLNLFSINGVFSGFGEAINSSVSFWSNSTYSLNVSTIFCALKLIVESFGAALTSTGGNESLGPPVGGIMLAQPGPVIMLIKMMQMIMNMYKQESFFINNPQT